MPTQVLIPLPLFKEVFSNVQVQSGFITGVLKKKNEKKLVTGTISKSESNAKSQKVCKTSKSG